MNSLWQEPYVQMLFWSALTIAAYWIARRLHARFGQWWLAPIALTPALLLAVALPLHVSYRDYLDSTGWLLAMLGPTTVAFAVPIYEHRALLRRHWPVLMVGMVIGTATALGTAWLFASLLGLDDEMRLSLLPRSISTPFAMQMSENIGGIPNLTAIFVVLTGVFGALVGEILLKWLPLRTSLARGALLGLGAHGAGTAQAYQLGEEEGSVAGLLMILVGLLNVLVAAGLLMVQ
ncbi:LrgB family protein [Methyloligella solikamskensis]|uniref:LrgB family protein n=1 Tax=Methyloligella solikamskensis TaxID=1177756 RepID=A0ABW3JAG5_9HYPH